MFRLRLLDGLDGLGEWPPVKVGGVAQDGQHVCAVTLYNPTIQYHEEGMV